MQVVKLDEAGLGKTSVSASHVLREGGVILYPTDTLYGLGADAFSDEAVDKVYAIKGRDMGKPMHAICADIAMVEEYAVLNDLARKLAQKFLPGALTIVMKKKDTVVGGIARNMKTIGIRIPDNTFCLEVAKSFGRPFTATSANTAGASAAANIEEILEQLGENSKMIDLVVDAGDVPLSPPSTVVDVSGGILSVLRIGAIPKSELDALMK